MISLFLLPPVSLLKLKLVGACNAWPRLTVPFLIKMIFKLLISLTAAASLCVSVHAKASARVIVDSWAKPEFLKARKGPNGLLPMSYVFAPGEYRGGLYSDKSLERMTITDIAQTLAKDLAAQKFYPAKVNTASDLLIVVHWGTTEIEEDLTEYMDVGEEGDELEGEESEQEEDLFIPEASATATPFSNGYFFRDKNRMQRNIELTGFGKMLNDRSLSPQERLEMEELLEDERYYIVLMAYDLKKLRTNEGTDLLWTTRFSLPGPGTNFEEAHYALSRAARNYFGTNLEKLVKAKTQLGRGDATMGELDIVGEVSEEELKNSR